MYLLTLILSVAVFALFVFFYARLESFNMYNPVTLYAAFHFFVFVLRPIFAYVYDYRDLYAVYGFLPTQSDKITVILAANLGFLAFTCCALLWGNRAVNFRTSVYDAKERIEMRRVYPWVLLLLGPLASYSIYRTIQDAASTGMMLDRSTGVVINTTSNGYVSDAQIMFATLAAIFAWLQRFRLWSMIPLAAFCLFRATSGTRFFIIYALVMVMLLYAFEKKLARPSLKVVAILGAIIWVFQIVGADRGATVRSAMGYEIDSATIQKYANRDKRPLAGMDFANMEFFEYLVWVVPQRSGTYDYFLDNAQVFTEPVPRMMWKDKPIGEPFRRISLFEFGFPIGMTRSLPGEGWYALGWFGVAIWCGLWGFIYGQVYRRFATGPKTTLRIASYIIFETTLIAHSRDGQMVQLVRQLGLFMMPCLVWWGMARLAGVRWSSPHAADALRKYQRELRVNSGQAAEGELPEDQATSQAIDHLPPAVRRRRLALARGS